ncbi:MAG: hypothetical protein JRJ29_12655 [Deltaproteobacteria bacterium]|nr:hypothetical protein [Deltaproteobacteria bacterium]
MAYLLLYCGSIIAVVFAFTQGLLIDTYSAGLFGLFSLLYLSLYWVVAIGSKFFDFNSISGQFLLVLVAVLVKDILFIVVLEIFHLGSELSALVLVKLSASAVFSALAAPLVFRLVDPFRHVFTKGDNKDIFVKGGTP